MLKEFKIKVPDEFLDFWGSKKAALEEVQKLFVLGLVWKKKISQGRGAELLGMNRWDFMDLMAAYNIPTLDMKPEELGKGVENLRKALGRKSK